MIRERRHEDLDSLCAVLAALGHPPDSRSDQDRRRWLQELDAEVSWVFDQAPVSVAPTRNVVAHAQVYRLDPVADGPLVETTGHPAGDLLAIGRLFVRHSGYQAGIARFLLRESVRHIQAQGRLPVLDLRESRSLSPQLCQRLGFTPTAPAEAGSAFLVLRP